MVGEGCSQGVRCICSSEQEGREKLASGVLQRNLQNHGGRTLYYLKFSSSLKKRGFEANPYNLCVWNKLIKGTQITICFHVDGCKISYLLVRVVDYTIEWLREEYESVFTNGTGKIKVARGKVHTYLGMTLDFMTPKIVKVTIFEYINEMIESWD